ncbi:MAG: hypothetical protein WC716_14900 [Chitinophagaceae bacterium]|jgi:hypothetical protein
MRKKFFKFGAKAMLVTLTYQLVFPACAYALTTGPSQPEVQSFEPVGTTDMVDMFSGDFNYNIPLMDVEGYPINIFYHSGVGIEQEASWVGLGWNINPGEINRSIRGLPDDFNGETVEKTLNIKNEVDFRIGVGGDVALELFGKDLKELGLKLSLGGSLYVAHNNYRGLSSGVSTTVGLSCPVGSLGIGLGVGTQSGADKDLFASLRTPSIIDKASLGVSVNAGVGYNSRAGLKDISIGVSAYVENSRTYKRNEKDTKTATKTSQNGMSASTTIPIGVQNYVPVISNKMVQKGFQLQLKAGFSAVGVTTSCFLEGMRSEAEYEKDASKNAYGYLYLQNSHKEDILDFSREKDGVYNKTLQNLPASTLNYDIFSVNGHGAGGMFRPFRNDIGTIYDPYVSPEPASNNKSIQSEVGVPGPDYAEGGTDFTYMLTRNQSGPWVYQKFSPKGNGNLFENVFFKQAGELTYNQQQEVGQIFNDEIQYIGEDLSSLNSKGKNSYGSLPTRGDGYKMFWNGGLFDRSSRATNISFQTAEQIMRIPDMDMAKKIVSYSSTTADPAYQFYNPKLIKYDRYYTNGTGPQHKAKPHHISEFTQTMPDGRRYVYGIPAMNNVSKEVTFAINERSGVDLNTGYVTYNSRQNSVSDTSGRDNFYSSTVTPGSAHSYLLTSLLSNDYVDILGDGPSDDDLGTFVKYNYELKCDDYRWKTPYPANTAQYNPGYWSDKEDGKGNYLIGSRQQWYVRSMETKNYVAEFYTSPRVDGKGVKDAILTDANTKLPDIYKSAAAQYEDYSYKLDSIKLYNKHDRYLNSNAATPVKTVIFGYSYNLCKNTPNSFQSALPGAKYGKLTLERIYIKYGNSQKNLLSPYVFEYKGQNPNYNFAAKDRWGNYKKVVSGVHNYEFPYTEQPDVLTGDNSVEEQNNLLSSWNLTDIKLPSGGKIHVDYESDDYSFVQDKRAMQMMKVVGVGSSEKMVPQGNLYADKDNINDYIYFQRRTGKEIPGLSLWDNYLEGQKLLYYSFSLDVSGTGAFEHINGYGKIDKVGICDGNPNYGFVKLKRENVEGLEISPITLLGINTGRYYLPHVFYDGYSVGNSGFNTVKSLAAKIPELFRTIFNQNPFKDFLKKRKANNIQLANSWIRVQTPGLTKKGGGIRVKQLTLSDNWKSIAGNDESKYGKKYDYTITHDRYGVISSGIASYEPMIGADENPFRNPVPYSVEKGKGMPSVDFFQEEPFGESFFPAASVGYSNVKVSSIHSEYGRSSQALNEYEFYTAKDFPIRVDFSEKDPSEKTERTLRKQFVEAKVLQGYVVQMNDMHGKPKSVNNYVVHKNGPSSINELITSNKYNYNVDNQGRLDNNVTALMRKRGSQNTYEIRSMLLGQDVDFTIDSRMRESSTTSDKKMFGVNVLQILGVPTPVPSMWKSFKTDTKIFKSLVSTKIVQQYGILKSVEFIDHGSKTITENMIYDAETGSPLLTKTNNEYSDFTCNLSHPAYLAYEGMRPAYTNDAYEEVSDSLVVNYDRDGYLFTDNLKNFTSGDELLVEYDAKAKKYMKLWVTGVGIDTSKPKTVVLPDSGMVSFAKVITRLYECYPAGISVYFNVSTTTNPSVTKGFISKDVIGKDGICNHPDAVKRKLPAGDYTVDAVASYGGSTPPDVGSQSFTVKKGLCIEVAFSGKCREKGQLIVKKHHVAEKRASDFELTPLFIAGVTTHKKVGKLHSGNGYEYSDCGILDGDYIFKYNDGRDKWHSEIIHITAGMQNEVMIKVNVIGGPEILTYTRALPAECEDDGGTPRLISVEVTGTEEHPESFIASMRCGVKVSPRFKDKISGTTNYSTWPIDKTMYPKVAVKILRSGRRNNLNQAVQQTTFRSAGNNADITNPSTLNKLFEKTLGILNMTVNTFTDSAQIYESFIDEMDIPGDYKYGLFNPFVLGQLGTFRPLASYVPIAQRSYAQNYTLSAGLFQVPVANQFWNIINSRAISGTACTGKTDILSENTLTGTQFWKMASKIVRYDIFGNALEEQDAIGNYSSAQYGYNKSLPVSVASNARYQQFMFDGFEEYNMLLPQKIAALFLKGDLYTAFGTYFGNITSGSLFARYGQNFYKRNLAPLSSAIVLTRDANHTGNFSLYANSANTIPFSIGDAQANSIGVFKFAGGKKYLLQLWAHKASAPVTSGMFKANINGGTDVDMAVKTGAIDGWYQVEAILDLAGVTTGNVNLKLPSGTYVDDIRAMPVTSNMKSFVYDPITFKLMAQLDENHMATFFEYDQEGLLVRTKKETQNGIVTISESRRSNNKPTVEETPDPGTTIAEELRTTDSPY